MCGRRESNRKRLPTNNKNYLLRKPNKIRTSHHPTYFLNSNTAQLTRPPFVVLSSKGGPPRISPYRSKSRKLQFCDILLTTSKDSCLNLPRVRRKTMRWFHVNAQGRCNPATVRKPNAVAVKLVCWRSCPSPRCAPLRTNRNHPVHLRRSRGSASNIWLDFDGLGNFYGTASGSSGLVFKVDDAEVSPRSIASKRRPRSSGRQSPGPGQPRQLVRQCLRQSAPYSKTDFSGQSGGQLTKFFPLRRYSAGVVLDAQDKFYAPSLHYPCQSTDKFAA